ncbi:DUF4845 domain-containing protein [Marinicellulosiphila megalodicopiae]|uniref:DUF4845 domain-containing protein n=1 Tax=Marinicellulosiphila megalodicopiae TaxID=2724896 RepID=UPI003BB1EE55
MIRSQKGASLYSIAILIVVVLFFAKFGIEVIPKYITNLEYKKHVESTISKFESNAIINQRLFNEAFKKTVITSNWNRKVEDEVSIAKKGNGYEVKLHYIDRSNLFHNIDVMIEFNDTFIIE